MAHTQEDVLEMLRELGELTALDEGDRQSFRVRAYENAASAIREHGAGLGQLTGKELEAIKGVGKSTAAKVNELLTTGKVAKLEELRARYPAAVVALLRLQGVGPKMVQTLRSELGVASMADLRAALATHKVRDLKGFGAKSEEKLRHALERLDAQGPIERTPISVALPLAQRIVATLEVLPGVRHASYCGSLRRFAETVGDIDVLVAADDARVVMDAVVALPFVDHVISQGAGKTSFVTRRGTQVDVRVVLVHQLGAARVYFTGSKGHNIRLRQRALERGLTLNEYGLVEVESGRVVASETEAQIYEALGLPFIPPVLREDGGELEAAEQGLLPASYGPVLGDFHVHTTVSGDGRSPLEDVVATAKARGYRVLCITDHAEGTISGVGREAFLEQRRHFRALQRELGDSLRLLHGVELNIHKDGAVDFDAEFRRGFDFCLASVHDQFDLDRESQTARVLRAMQDPTVRMIGHLSARMIGGRPPIELDLDAVVNAAVATGTALEINGGLPRLDLSVDALRHARGRDVELVLTSDAHHESELMRVDYAALNAQRGWVRAEQVVNAGSEARLTRWLARPKSVGNGPP